MIKVPLTPVCITTDREIANIVREQLQRRILPAVSMERPDNLSVAIPEGFTEDVKKFSIANVDSTITSKELTELEPSLGYIIKEIRFYFSGTAQADAYFHVAPTSVDGFDRFMQGYYFEGSFCMLSGNQNGRTMKVLRQKPYVFITAGTGATAQTVYGSVKYYYR